MKNYLRFITKGGGKHKNLMMVSILCLASLNVTACDFINSKLYPDFRANDVKTSVNKPPFARDISIEKVRDVAESTHIEDPNFTVNDVKIKDQKIASNVETATSLPPVKMAEVRGLNTVPPKDISESQIPKLSVPPAIEPLPVKAITRNITPAGSNNNTVSDRLASLEREVAQIQSTIAKMAPSITKLIGIERDLDNLTFQLEDIIRSGNLNKNMALRQPQDTVTLPAPSTITPLKKPVKVAEQPLNSVKSPAITKAASTGTAKRDLSAEEINQAAEKEIKTQSLTDSTIKNIRIGDHSGKTRIVIETDSFMEYEAVVDNQENLLMMAVPTTSISIDPSKAVRKSALIQGILKDEIDDNMVLAFGLKKSSSILSEERIPPSSANRNHRIVIDLKR